MATVQLPAYDHSERAAAPTAEGFCVTSAMAGGALGATTAAASVGGSFEYAAVLVGTLGVVLGSVVAGIAGHYLLYPAVRAIRGRRD
jgi:hypothetical protein